ncbi:MAG TPA: hypothetical protein PLS84_04915 [Salinivirgaceae bacterium]|nr:hypothetical protein [Salinivirgaceae bacterium]
MDYFKITIGITTQTANIQKTDQNDVELFFASNLTKEYSEIIPIGQLL